MHPIITMRTWEHNALLQAHELMENSLRLFRDTFFWAMVILLTLLVVGFILSMDVPKSLNLNVAPMYPFPMSMM